jgi:hypothetical protein
VDAVFQYAPFLIAVSQGQLFDLDWVYDMFLAHDQVLLLLHLLFL